MNKNGKKIKALSLFANVGIAETYLNEIGIDVKVANEIDETRAKFYNHLYPNVDMVIGDITKDKIQSKIIEKAKKSKIDLLIATPPCQGMSTVGKKDKDDIRNLLICDTVKIIKKIKPKYVFIENVPEQLKTYIKYNGENICIPDYIKKELSKDYIVNEAGVINACDYGVPQNRERAIILLTRKDTKVIWKFPKKSNKIITLEDAIGDLPILDPYVTDITDDERNKLFPKYESRRQAGLKISKWFYPPKHIYRQVYSMMHTPTGKSAFDNDDEFKPHKIDGTIVKGFKNTYKRQDWNKPAFTVTMYNRTIGSQDNVHPGRLIGKDTKGNKIYSDPRVMTIYELMIITSLPKDWDIPEWATDSMVRQVIGEGIPPLLVKKIMKGLMENCNA